MISSYLAKLFSYNILRYNKKIIDNSFDEIDIKKVIEVLNTAKQKVSKYNKSG